MVCSGADSKARGNTAAGVKRTLSLVGCEERSGKSPPFLQVLREQEGR